MVMTTTSLLIEGERVFHECSTSFSNYSHNRRAGSCGIWDGHVYPRKLHQYPYVVWSHSCPRTTDPGCNGGFHQWVEKAGSYRDCLRAHRADFWRHAAD